MIDVPRAKSAVATAAAKSPLGDLPTWNLSDLYRGMDDQQLRDDLRRAETDAAALETPNLAHYRPWIEDVRKEKPYQLEDRVELLFHEKSVTAYSAWNRLFDETIAAVRFTVDGEEMPIEPTLNFLQDGDEKKRQAAAEGLAATFKRNI